MKSIENKKKLKANAEIEFALFHKEKDFYWQYNNHGKGNLGNKNIIDIIKQHRDKS